MVDFTREREPSKQITQRFSTTRPAADYTSLGKIQKPKGMPKLKKQEFKPQKLQGPPSFHQVQKIASVLRKLAEPSPKIPWQLRWPYRPLISRLQFISAATRGGVRGAKGATNLTRRAAWKLKKY